MFTAHFDPSFLARVPDVQAALADGSAQVVDARRPERFQGRDPEPWPVVNIGHMPGAVNLPMTTVVRAGSLLEADDLRGFRRGRGRRLHLSGRHDLRLGGHRADSQLALARLGKPIGRLYYGSWANGARADLPAVTV